MPVRLRAAEEILERDGLSDATVEAAARRAAELVDPPSDIHASADYRRNLTRVLTIRALRRAITRVNTLSPSRGEGRVTSTPSPPPGERAG
jgi:carbon-monoxide dehydrogenase medium subunit